MLADEMFYRINGVEFLCGNYVTAKHKEKQ